MSEEPPTPDPATPAVRRRLGPWLLACAAAAVLVAIGSFMTWADALDGAVTKSGLDGDGAITLVIAIVGIVLALAFRLRTWVVVVQLVLALICVLIGAVDIQDVSGADDELGADLISVGAGLYLVTVAAAAWAVCALVALVTSRRGTTPA